MTNLFARQEFRPPIRFALLGPTGSGKTWMGLSIGTELARSEGGRLAVIDTEYGSASLYLDEQYAPGRNLDFDSLTLEDFDPKHYIAGIKNAQAAGYKAILIDSLSHAWIGKGGLLQQKENVVKRSGGKKNDYTAWGDITPIQQELVDTMLSCKIHLIVTMRVKMDVVQEKDSNGRTVIRKIGLQPQQRDGLEYEFSICGDVDPEHNLIVSKTRCRRLDGYVQNKPDLVEFSKILIDWRNGLKGEAAPSFTKTPVNNPCSNERLKAIGSVLGVKGGSIKQIIEDFAFEGVESSVNLTDEQCNKVILSLVAGKVGEEVLTQFAESVGNGNEATILSELMEEV